MRDKIFFLTLTIMLALAGTILAEENKSFDLKAIELEPITVTASRASRIISESPANVSVISSPQIAESNANNIPYLLNSFEGVYSYDASGVGTSGAVNMRGFYGGMSTHQLVLVDGIPQNKGKDKLVDWDLIALDNVENIEVVRGPVSALYGDNAMSGVINIITKQPAQKPKAKIFASYSNFDTQEYKAFVSGSYKKSGLLLGFSQKTTDGFREHGNYSRQHVDTRFNYDIKEDQKISFLLDHYEKKRGAYPWALSEAQINQNRRQARPGTEDDSAHETKSDIDLSHRWDIDYRIKTEGTFYYRNDESDSFYTSGSTQSTKKEQLENEDVYGLLLKADLNQQILGMEHKFTTGLDWENDYFDYEEYKAPYQVRGALQSDYNVKRDKVGPYLQDEIKLFEPLRLIAGARYDQVNFDFGDLITVSNSKTEKMDRTTPRCSLIYMYKNDSSLYFNYAQAFRTPTIGQMFTYGASANPDLQPEEATNYEIGMHHNFNKSVRANLSLYWMKVKNEIWYDYATRKYENLGRTLHKGIETGLNFKANKYISGFINYSYSPAKNISGTYDGQYLTNVPIHKASFGAQLNTNFGLTWDLSGTYNGTSYIDSLNNNILPSYTTIDTKISYKYKFSKTFFGINNLFDKIYNSYGYVSGTTKNFNPAPGRTFIGGLELEF